MSAGRVCSHRASSRLSLRHVSCLGMVSRVLASSFPIASRPAVHWQCFSWPCLGSRKCLPFQLLACPAGFFSSLAPPAPVWMGAGGCAVGGITSVSASEGWYSPGVFGVRSGPKQEILSSCGQHRKGWSWSVRVIVDPLLPFSFQPACSLSRSFPYPPGPLASVTPRTGVQEASLLAPQRSAEAQSSTALPCGVLTRLCSMFSQIEPRGAGSGRSGPGCWPRGRRCPPSCPTWTPSPHRGPRRGRETRECRVAPAL